MVNKTSLLSKLKNRWKAGGDLQRDGLESLPVRSTTSSRKLSDKQEALMTLGEGFKELSDMMRGVQVRLEDQDGRMAEVADNTRGQLEVLKSLTGNLELLPDTMRELKKALDRTAATDERTSRTLNEFQHHMDKIQGSMEQMVEHSRTQSQATSSLTKGQDEQRSKQTDAIRGLVRELGATQSQAVGRMEEATGKHLQSLKHVHQDQSQRLLKLMAASGKWNRAVLVVLIVVLGGIATLFALQLFV